MNSFSFGAAGCGLNSASGASSLNPGEFLVVPHGVEDRTVADEEAQIVLFEPAATRNTGSAGESALTAPGGVRI